MTERHNVPARAVVRTRITQEYGQAVAAQLVADGDAWLLNAPGGPIRFFRRTTHLLSPLATEVERAGTGALSFGNKALVVTAGSSLEREWVRERLAPATSIEPRRRDEGTARRKTASPPSPLDRALDALWDAGFRARSSGLKPEHVTGLRAYFRHVPGYGLCLDARGLDIHFLPSETRLFKPSGAERTAVMAQDKTGQADWKILSLPAGSALERELVRNRLKQLATSPEDESPGFSSAKALATPLGQAIHLHLPRLVESPFNLLGLPRGVSVRRAAVRVAVVRADRASVGDLTINGDFLTPGVHWRYLSSAIADYIEGLVTEAKAPVEPAAVDETDAEASPHRPPPTAWRPVSDARLADVPSNHSTQPQGVGSGRARTDLRFFIDAPPADVPADLVGLCLSASRAIRVERNIAPALPVTLFAPGFEITFDPVERRMVSFTTGFIGRQPIEGLIWLWTKDPLTLVFEEAPPAVLESRIWAIALLGFWALTVRPEVDGHAYGSRHGGIAWSDIQAHVVAGHRRRLPDYHEASAEKVHEAATLGIKLAPGHTWVTAHVRGAHGTLSRAVRLAWKPPAELRGVSVDLDTRP